MSRDVWSRLVHGFRRMAVPLAAYYVVTLGLPLANGAWRSGLPFVKHALVVLIVPPVAIVVALGLWHPWRVIWLSLVLLGSRLYSIEPKVPAADAVAPASKP